MRRFCCNAKTAVRRGAGQPVILVRAGTGSGLRGRRSRLTPRGRGCPDSGGIGGGEEPGRAVEAQSVPGWGAVAVLPWRAGRSARRSASRARTETSTSARVHSEPALLSVTHCRFATRASSRGRPCGSVRGGSRRPLGPGGRLGPAHGRGGIRRVTTGLPCGMVPPTARAAAGAGGPAHRRTGGGEGR